MYYDDDMSPETSHEVTIFAEPIFEVGGFHITNSLLNTWLAVFVVIIFGLAFRRAIGVIPRKAQNILEMIVEQLLGVFDSVTNSREKSLRFFPLIASFFFFVLLNNWLGLLPGIGSIGKIVSEHGEKVFVPFFRGGTADLNTTLALAIVGVVSTHLIGMTTVGVWCHLNKFINIQSIIDIPGKVTKDAAILIVNPIKLFVGFIEIVGELAKVASLSFRLCGNIFAGEVLLASMSAILAFGIPIPFMFLEIVVGLIQALIFAMLILVYLTIHTSVEEH